MVRPATTSPRTRADDRPDEPREPPHQRHQREGPGDVVERAAGAERQAGEEAQQGQRVPQERARSGDEARRPRAACDGREDRGSRGRHGRILHRGIPSAVPARGLRRPAPLGPLPLAQRQRHHLGQVQRAATGGLGDLLAAAEPVGQDEGVGRRRRARRAAARAPRPPSRARSWPSRSRRSRPCRSTRRRRWWCADPAGR